MKKILLQLLLLLILGGLQAQENLEFLKQEHTFLKDQKYGQYERNNFDIVLPTSGKPTALVIFFHGGGFVGGDKSNGLKQEEGISSLLDNNIAFATANYRYRISTDSLGVKVCLNDCKTFLQYIRHNADRYNINKNLIACYGSSAGAGTSLYLAFKDDMSIKNDTSLLGESTRIKCAGALATQATYDIYRWRKIIPGLRLVSLFMRKSLFESTANFYGFPTYKEFKPFKKEIPRSVDMLEMIDPEDPPIYVYNNQKKRFPSTMGIIQHHRRHAIVLGKNLKKNNIEHYVYTYSKKIRSQKDIEFSILEFFVDHLK